MLQRKDTDSLSPVIIKDHKIYVRMVNERDTLLMILWAEIKDYKFIKAGYEQNKKSWR